MERDFEFEFLTFLQFIENSSSSSPRVSTGPDQSGGEKDDAREKRFKTRKHGSDASASTAEGIAAQTGRTATNQSSRIRADESQAECCGTGDGSELESERWEFDEPNGGAEGRTENNEHAENGKEEIAGT